MNKKTAISQSIMWASALLVVALVDSKEMILLLLAALAVVSLGILQRQAK